MHSAAFDLSGASKGNRMCPRGAPSSISRNSLSLFTLLLNCGRRCRRRHHRRAALFFFPQCSSALALSFSLSCLSRFPWTRRTLTLNLASLLPNGATSVRLARSVRLALFFFFCFASSAHPSHQLAPLGILPSPSLCSSLLFSIGPHGTPPDFSVPPLFSQPFHDQLAPRPSQPLFSFSRSYTYLLAIISFHWPSLPRRGNSRTKLEEQRSRKKEPTPFSPRYYEITAG